MSVWRAKRRVSTPIKWYHTLVTRSTPTATRQRLDTALVDRGLADSRARAQELIAAGRVTVGGAPAGKASRQVSPAEPIVIADAGTEFVSRGGSKLRTALDRFAVVPDGVTALDLGASTGGFTDCLLAAGADRVVAVDVGTHQLHERLRSDERVTSLEQTDVRSLDEAFVAEHGPFDLAVVDLSFISTTGLLPDLARLARPGGDLIVLVKPQFEAGRRDVSRGAGVIRDPEVWRRVLHRFIDRAAGCGAPVVDLMTSPVTGAKGNVEFLAHLRRPDILGA